MGRFTCGLAGSIRGAFSPPGPVGNRPAGDLAPGCVLRASRGGLAVAVQAADAAVAQAVEDQGE
jgi:hypothetical protein